MRRVRCETRPHNRSVRTRGHNPQEPAKFGGWKPFAAGRPIAYRSFRLWREECINGHSRVRTNRLGCLSGGM
ncbi:MAG: hypothetical protein MI923_09070 [Phycisphaerales bacterium]|nr:hypothetical protein [Phycisphaerales bacterium]